MGFAPLSPSYGLPFRAERAISIMPESLDHAPNLGPVPDDELHRCVRNIGKGQNGRPDQRPMRQPRGPRRNPEVNLEYDKQDASEPIDGTAPHLQGFAIV